MKTYKINQQTVDLVRHIFQARIDRSTTISQRMAYHCAQDVFEYALAGNLEALQQFDYLLSNDDIAKGRREN